MPRGSRPGERRGGRKPGTPNKKTLLENAVFCAAAADPNRSPLDFMLALMRDPQVPLNLRLDMAAAAAPFVHARPRPPDHSGSYPMELRARRAKTAAQNRGANGAPAGREESPSLQPALSDGEEKPTLQQRLPDEPEKVGFIGGGEAVIVRLASAGPQAAERFEIRSPGPLDFLMAVMIDPEAAPRQRMRAAKVAVRYKHKLADWERPAELVEDEFGFKIDPAVATRIREIAGECDSLARTGEPDLGLGTRRDVSPEDVQKHKTLVKQLHEQIATIECPTVYGWADLHNDEIRLNEIGEQASKHRKMPADLDAEEAYLTARIEIYRATPRHQAWCRISGLEVRRARGYTLTEVEIDELAVLLAKFPGVAQEFANRDWSRYVWGTLIALPASEKFFEACKRGEQRRTPDQKKRDKHYRQQSRNEQEERDKVFRRRAEYLEQKRYPEMITHERWFELASRPADGFFSGACED
jgi:hypothetical protein